MAGLQMQLVPFWKQRNHGMACSCHPQWPMGYERRSTDRFPKRKTYNFSISFINDYKMARPKAQYKKLQGKGPIHNRNHRDSFRNGQGPLYIRKHYHPNNSSLDSLNNLSDTFHNLYYIPPDNHFLLAVVLTAAVMMLMPHSFVSRQGYNPSALHYLRIALKPHK